MATTSKSFFNYFLSIIGLDRISTATTTTTTTTTLSTTTGSSSSSSIFSNNSYNSSTSNNSSKTNISFMSDSTLFVNADTAGVFDEKFVQDAGINMIPYDTWSLQTWLNGLSRMALCKIITSNAMKYPRLVLQMIEEYQPSNKYYRKQEQEQTKIKSSLYDHRMNDKKEQDNNDFCHYQEILTIQNRARSIIHSLDHLRPSEQFAHEAEIAKEIQCVIRWCTNILHASTGAQYASSLVALVGLLVIAREALSAVPEIRKYLFGKAYLGRMMILEMNSVLKNFKKSPLHHYYHSHRNNNNNISLATTTTTTTTDYNLLKLPYQWSLLLKVLDSPQQIIQDSYHCQVTWLIQLLTNVCHQMASYDKEWMYFQEYHNVITIATQNYCDLL